MTNIKYSINNDVDKLLPELNHLFNSYYDNIATVLEFPNVINSATIENLFKTGIFENEIGLDDYLLIKKAYEKIYDIYSSDYKSFNLNETNEVFKSFFEQKLGVKNQFNILKNWPIELDYQVNRKNSEKFILEKGKSITYEVKNFENNFANSDIITENYDFSLKNKSENYFWIYGNAPKRNDILIRVYLNFKPIKEKIYSLIEIISSHFNERNMPFAFKFMSDIVKYQNRSDCGVIYLSKKHSLSGFNLLQKIARKFEKEDFFCEGKTLFTLPLKKNNKIIKGISFGEEPDNPIFQVLDHIELPQ